MRGNRAKPYVLTSAVRSDSFTENPFLRIEPVAGPERQDLERATYCRQTETDEIFVCKACRRSLALLSGLCANFQISFSSRHSSKNAYFAGSNRPMRSIADRLCFGFPSRCESC